MSAEDQALVESVVTALPNEVAGCTFVGDINQRAYSVEGAQNFAKIEAAKMGANHIVITNIVSSFDSGFGFYGGFGSSCCRWGLGYYPDPADFNISARAYLCEKGQGVKTMPPAKTIYSQEDRAAVQEVMGHKSLEPSSKLDPSADESLEANVDSASALDDAQDEAKASSK